MTTCLLRAATAAAAVAVSSSLAPAEETAKPPLLEWHAFGSVSYVHSFDDPPSERLPYRVFDTREDLLGDVELSLLSNPSPERRFGFRLDLVAGNSIPRVSAASGLGRSSSGDTDDVDLQQVFVSYLFGQSGVRLDGGKFVSHMGYEGIEGWDGYNDNVSRSFLFGWAVPFTQTGLRLTVPLGEKAATTLFALRGWDTFDDANDHLSFGAQLTGTMGPVTAALNWIGGPEQPDQTESRRDVVDVWAAWTVSDAFKLALNADYGRESDLLPGGGTATWQGAAVYARWQATPRWALAARAERFDDEDGTRTGVAQTLDEITLTPEYKPNSWLVLRADLRHDRSDVDVFEDDAGLPADSQTTLQLNAVVVLPTGD